MTTTLVILAVTVFWTCLIVGVLIGISVHRGMHRRRVHRHGLEQREINAQREDLHDSWAELQEQRRDLESGRRRSLG